MEDNKNIKKVIILLVILLVISIVALGGSIFFQYVDEARPASITLPGESDSSGNSVINIQNPENTSDNFAIAAGNAERTKLSLYRGHSEEKVMFKTVNMLPGDKEYRAYSLSVTYSGTVIVRFRADVTLEHSIEGYTKGDPSAKLADVLIVRIDIEGKKVYEGTLGKMPKELTYTLNSQEKTVDYIDYDIYAWLPKGVDSAYEQKQLEAEFCWLVAGGSGASSTGQLEESPETGAAFANPLVLISAASTSFFAMILIVVLGRKKKR